MLARVDDKTALITGVTSGIGRVTALRLAAEGAHVAVGGRDVRRGAAVVADITAAGGRAVFVPADLDGTRVASRDIAVRAEAALGGHVDALVNNAAVVAVATTAGTTKAQLAAAWAVKVAGPFFLVAHLAPAMAARGGGAIVGISSWMAQGGTAGREPAPARRSTTARPMPRVPPVTTIRSPVNSSATAAGRS